MIRLFELRTERELSQRNIAKIMNVSQGTYNNWENSNTQPSIEQLIALADFFEVSVDYLIGHSNNFETNKNNLTDRQREILKLTYNAEPEIQNAVITILSARLNS